MTSSGPAYSRGGLRDWLRNNNADRHRYARVKRQLAALDWKYVQQYADAKTDVIREIMTRAEASRNGRGEQE